MENLKLELQEYIDANYIEEISDANFCFSTFEDFEDLFPVADKVKKDSRTDKTDSQFIKSRKKPAAVSSVLVPDSNMILAKNTGETFSQMLVRLIDESGEKNSVIYNRANVDRRLFSKIIKNAHYRPTKNTALAFAISLKLNYQMTQKLLDAAGFTLNRKNLGDVIITFYIEHKIFDINSSRNS